MKTIWNKGINLTESHKSNISRSLKGRIAWNKGKQLTEEHKQKIAQSMKQKV